MDNKKNLGGRHTLYTEELSNKICAAIASNPISLRRICEENPDFPDEKTIWSWLSKVPGFLDKYALAKHQQMNCMSDSILDDIEKIHKYIDDNGNERHDPGFIAHQRLRIDTKKWFASKLMPKLYGDRSHTESTLTVKTHEQTIDDLA
jgi:hypothetical protein